MDLDAELVAVAGEPAGHVDQHALLDVVQDLLVAALVADEQQAQAIVLQYLQRLARHVGLGVTRPGHAQFAQLPRDRLGARQVVGERVVVEEELPHLRKHLLCMRYLGCDVGRAAGAVAVAADRLRPETERAARFATAPGVDGDVGVLQVADKVVLDPQVPLVDVGYERQRVHVLDNGAVTVVDDHARTVAERDAVDRRQVTAVGDLLDREIELVAGHVVDAVALLQALSRLHGYLGADEADLQRRLVVLEGLGDFHIGGE